MGRLVHLGEAATQEMIANGDFTDSAFDNAAALAAREAGLSDDEIIDMYGYLPPALLRNNHTTNDEEPNNGGSVGGMNNPSQRNGIPLQTE